MSSDNGIFVLQSPNALTGSLEYRVAYAGAIENIDYFELGSEHYFAMEVLMFGQSKVHTNELFALQEAKQMQEDIGYTEYGICFISKRVHSFSTMSETEAKAILKPFC